MNAFALARTIISACWGIFFIVWVVAAIFTKRTVYRESRSQRLRYTIPIVIGCLLVFRRPPAFHPFNVLIIPHTEIIALIAAVLCVCGLAICFWARAILGRNW